MGRVIALLAMALTLAAVRGAEAPSPRIEALLELCETSRRGAILQAEQRLRALKAGQAATTSSTKQIRRVENELRILRENKQLMVPPLRFPPEVGAIGRLPRLSCHVDQVLSADEMLVRCFFNVKVVSVERFQPRGDTVVQPVTFLVHGLPTRDAMEGADLELTQVFEVAGTQSLTGTGGGQVTALRLQPFDLRAIEPYFKDFKAAHSGPR